MKTALSYLTVIGRGTAKYRVLSMASRSAFFPLLARLLVLPMLFIAVNSPTLGVWEDKMCPNNFDLDRN